MKAKKTILDTIGSTPMVRINALSPNPKVKIFAKLEGFNPTGSIKDRIALRMIEAAERDGRLTPGKTIIEPTSGNTGIGLAIVGIVKGYPVEIVMSEAVSIERRKIIRSHGGIDLQLLGLGRNGHIGFNEPGEAFEKETHCVDLTESTIEANKRFFASADDVPKQAYTMGIKTIMQAKKILIVVNGENKADIVERAFFGPVTPEVPASILQLHNDVTLVGDEAALAKIGI